MKKAIKFDGYLSHTLFKEFESGKSDVISIRRGSKKADFVMDIHPVHVTLSPIGGKHEKSKG